MTRPTIPQSLLDYVDAEIDRQLAPLRELLTAERSDRRECLEYLDGIETQLNGIEEAVAEAAAK